MLIGSHVSVAGGVEQAFPRATQLCLQAMQIFTKNASQWFAKPINDLTAQRFKQEWEVSTVDRVVAHGSYLINLASPNEELFRKSLVALREEVERAEQLELEGVILHPGAHMGTGEQVGLQKVVSGINQVLEDTAGYQAKIFVENTAGQGTTLGNRVEHLGHICTHIHTPERIGTCFDTCHAFAAGYHTHTPESYYDFWEQFRVAVGVLRPDWVHANDCKSALGSRVDRHEHLGQGQIGQVLFALLMTDPQLRYHPLILETPKDMAGLLDKKNIAYLKRMRAVW